MIPKGSAGIGHLTTRIFTHLLPGAEDAYQMSDLAFLAGLVAMVGQDFDRGVDVLMQDRQDINEIFLEAIPHVANTSLKERMMSVVNTKPESFKLTDLNAEADIAMRTLIDLHEHVENAQDEGAAWASALNDRIWTFLDAHVERRKYDVPM
ncbi:MAG: hypothetical protein WA138_07085 [Parvibaculum sp.]